MALGREAPVSPWLHPCAEPSRRPGDLRRRQGEFKDAMSLYFKAARSLRSALGLAASNRWQLERFAVYQATLDVAKAA